MENFFNLYDSHPDLSLEIKHKDSRWWSLEIYDLRGGHSLVVDAAEEDINILFCKAYLELQEHVLTSRASS